MNIDPQEQAPGIFYPRSKNKPDSVTPSIEISQPEKEIDNGTGQAAKTEGSEEKGGTLLDWGGEAIVKLIEMKKLGGYGQGLLLRPLAPAAGGKQYRKIAVALADAPRSPLESLTLSAYLRGVPQVQFAIGIEVGDASIYFESVPIQLNSGWNRKLLFPLSQKTWKSSASSWQYNSSVTEGTIKRIILIVYTTNPNATIAFDDIFPILR